MRELISLPGISLPTYRDVGSDDENVRYASTLILIVTTSYAGTDRPLTCRTVLSVACLMISFCFV